MTTLEPSSSQVDDELRIAVGALLGRSADPTTLQQLQGGRNNYVFAIQTNSRSKAVLKIGSEHQRQRIEKEATVLDLLARSAVPAPRLHKINGLTINSIVWKNERRPVMAMAFIEGSPPKVATDFVKHGQALRLLHMVNPPSSVVNSNGRVVEVDTMEPGRLPPPVAAALPRDLDLHRMISTVQTLQQQTATLCQGDVPGNVLIDKRRATLIDFENAVADNSVFDLASAIFGCFLVHPGTDHWSHLLQGYASGSLLNKSIDFEQLADAAGAIGMRITLWRYNNSDRLAELHMAPDAWRQTLHLTSDLLDPHSALRQKIIAADLTSSRNYAQTPITPPDLGFSPQSH